jgi:hypothetical protein
LWALTTEQVFSLSSRPGAKNKLVLNFDGYLLEGSVWNDVKRMDSIESPPYDKDGDPSSFNAEEIAGGGAIYQLHLCCCLLKAVQIG